MPDSEPDTTRSTSSTSNDSSTRSPSNDSSTGRGTSVLVGTTKGAFVIDGTPDRTRWAVRGPFCDGWPINHVIADRSTGELWAGGGGGFTGAGVWHSPDHGETWELSRLSSGELDQWAANEPGLAGLFTWSSAPV
ncbi:MAG: hypothetical protein H5T81_08430, partial [Tetrasphaera sp.]|nr:hypothetical protein [Tetrasphaera sp.]